VNTVWSKHEKVATFAWRL